MSSQVYGSTTGTLMINAFLNFLEKKHTYVYTRADRRINNIEC